MTSIDVQYFDAPCGRLVLGGYDERLCLCGWTSDRHRERIDERLQRMLKARYTVQPSETVSRTMRELEEYFNGTRTQFDIPLLMTGTEFQKRVWQILCTIPYGATLSYGAEARRIDKPSAVRAVANANGANSIVILVPCHRVIGSDSALTGYSGGTDIKRFLLQLEQNKFLLSPPDKEYYEFLEPDKTI